ncbi:MAG: Crp/Fnr family transcriptional regulator, partial [Cyclobacteriaceae bacterium]
MEGLKKSMKQAVAFNDDEIEDFIQKGQLVKYKKRQIIMDLGTQCRHIYFIKSGCVRYCFLEQSGNERTGQFFFENTWFT